MCNRVKRNLMWNGSIEVVVSVIWFTEAPTWTQFSLCCCRAEAQASQRELAGLSERYSQKCLELNRAEQNNAEREREISRKERDMEQLRKENQVGQLQ